MKSPRRCYTHRPRSLWPLPETKTRSHDWSRAEKGFGQDLEVAVMDGRFSPVRWIATKEMSDLEGLDGFVCCASAIERFQ